MALRDIGREQVLAAIAEYDRLGRDEFLGTYGFHPAREYLLVHDGRDYDSKAIVGVAHGFLPGRQALKASEFSGGEATVGRLLRDLGFAVQVGTDLTADRLARILRNLDVNRPGGVRALYQPIMLLWAFGRASRGEERILGWQETERVVSALFRDFGRPGEERGRVAYPASALYGAGLWELDTRGEAVPRAHGSIAERWFREHQPAGGLVRSVYELIRDSPQARAAAVGALVATLFPDGGHVSLLTEVGFLIEAFPVLPPQDVPSLLPQSPLELAYRQLCDIAGRGASDHVGTRVTRVVSDPVRSAAARRAVLVRSGGSCEKCGTRVPDVTDAGDPILEVDHVWDLALGGSDDPAVMVALCPNCHAVKTRGRTRESLRAALLEIARTRHASLIHE